MTHLGNLGFTTYRILPQRNSGLLMRLRFSNTAVLLFALPDAAEASRKVVARRPGAVWRAMRALTKAKVRASGLPLLESGQLVAHQGTFGEQLSAALSAGFALGYDRIICIGNDCPDLSVNDLRTAALALAQNEIPIGPDKRGGIYLFGVQGNQFDAQALIRLPWQTEKAADALRACIESCGLQPVCLPVRVDVNQRIDATGVRVLRRGGTRLLAFIQQIVALAGQPIDYRQRPRLFLPHSDRIIGRAPPISTRHSG